MLRPDFAMREGEPREDGPRWQLLVKAIEPGDDFDRVAGGAGRLEVSAHGRMERQTGVPAGVLSNGRSFSSLRDISRLSSRTIHKAVFRIQSTSIAVKCRTSSDFWSA